LSVEVARNARTCRDEGRHFAASRRTHLSMSGRAVRANVEHQYPCGAARRSYGFDVSESPGVEGTSDGRTDVEVSAPNGPAGTAGRTREPSKPGHRWRFWGGVAATTGLVIVNSVYFLASLNNYLDANEQGSHLIDTGMVSDHVMITLWWQIIVNGVLLLAFRRTRRTGLGLLIAAALLFLLLFWAALSVADQMG
jgi:hypothetical protein